MKKTSSIMGVIVGGLLALGAEAGAEFEDDEWEMVAASAPRDKLVERKRIEHKVNELNVRGQVATMAIGRGYEEAQKIQQLSSISPALKKQWGSERKSLAQWFSLLEGIPSEATIDMCFGKHESSSVKKTCERFRKLRERLIFCMDLEVD